MMRVRRRRCLLVILKIRRRHPRMIKQRRKRNQVLSRQRTFLVRSAASFSKESSYEYRIDCKTKSSGGAEALNPENTNFTEARNFQTNRLTVQPWE